MEPWLVLARFVHYGASLVLFGLTLFPLYAHEPVATRSADSRTPTFLLPVSVLVLISGLLWFFGVTTSMTEDKMSWEATRAVLAETSFGTASLLRLGAAITAVGVLKWLIEVREERLGCFSS